MSETTLETKLSDELKITTSLDVEEEYNPLEFIEGEDDDDWMDDDSLILPSIVPPPSVEGEKQPAVFSPERAGSVAEAMRELVLTNVGRRPLLLSIITWTRNGMSAEELFKKIEEAEVDNLSVYEPVSYCRMLERAGAIELKLSASDIDSDADTSASSDSDKEAPQEFMYLTIDDELEPEWVATEEGLAVYEELMQGNEWREKVLGEDSRYAEVYRAVMSALAEEGKPKDELVALAETFEVTREPRKFGAYFIDVLEATSALMWADMMWNLTGIGKKVLPELEEFCAQRQQADSSPVQEA